MAKKSFVPHESGFSNPNMIEVPGQPVDQIQVGGDGKSDKQAQEIVTVPNAIPATE